MLREELRLTRTLSPVAILLGFTYTLRSAYVFIFALGSWSRCLMEAGSPERLVTLGSHFDTLWSVE